MVSEMDSCVQRHSRKVIARYQDLNIRFHCFFAEIADHQRLRIMLHNLTAQMRRLSYQAFMDKDHMRSSNLEHEHILEAIRKGNKDEALKLTRLHMEKVSRRHKAIAAQSTF